MEVKNSTLSKSSNSISRTKGTDFQAGCLSGENISIQKQLKTAVCWLVIQRRAV